MPESQYEIVDDFLSRNLDVLAKGRNDREFHEMFQAAMDASFKKWCDDQRARSAGFLVVDNVATL